MKTVLNRQCIAIFIGLGLIALTGCKKDAPVEVKPAKSIAETEDASSEAAIPQAAEGESKERYDKIQQNDMYLERARKSIKPENLESEIRRLELEVRKFEEKLEKQEAVLEMAEGNEKKSPQDD